MADMDSIAESAVINEGTSIASEDTGAVETVTGGIAMEEGTTTPLVNTNVPAGIQPPNMDYEVTGSDDTPPLLRESLASFTEECKAGGLSKEQADRIMRWQTDRLAKAEAEQRRLTSQTLQQWNDEIRGDTDFGGSNYTRTVADARKALATFDPDGSLRELLRLTHGQYEPSVVRFAARVGRAMGEHEYVTGGGLGSTSQTSLAERMYGKSGTEVKHPL